MEDKIQEIMELVDEYAQAVEESVRGGDVICSALERETSIYKAIRSKLRKLVERCSVQEPLSNQDAETLIRDCDYLPWEIVKAVERAHNITNTTKE